MVATEIRDSLFVRLSIALFFAVGAAFFLVSAFGVEEEPVPRIVLLAFGIPSAYIGVASLFRSGVYFFDDRIEVRKWIRTFRFQRTEIAEFYQGRPAPSFTYRLGVRLADGRDEEVMVEGRLAKHHRFPELLDACNAWLRETDPSPAQDSQDP